MIAHSFVTRLRYMCPEVFCKKSVLKNFVRKAPVPESLFLKGIPEEPIKAVLL